MSDEKPITIEAEGLSKAYRIWASPSARLKYPIVRGLSRFRSTANGAVSPNAGNKYFKEFYALSSVSLCIRKGEAMGIVGRNGSGKSTLLQLIAGTLTPTTGTVKATGRVAALLELGSGFNPEFTGRENVFVYGSVLGLTRDSIEKKFASIAEFAEIGDFIDQPVRTYSSGMVVRLAFAVASHVDPEILIIDEALAVGDARFQLKCARAIDRFIERGTTILFVSHDISSVKRLCSQALLLDGGKVLHQGSPNDVANLYSKLLAEGHVTPSLLEDIQKLKSKAPEQPQTVEVRVAAAEKAAHTAGKWAFEAEEQLRRKVAALELAVNAHAQSEKIEKFAQALLENERDNVQVSGNEYSYGGERGRIVTVQMTDAAGVRRTWFNSGETVKVIMEVVAKEALPSPIFAMTMKSIAGVEVYGTNTLFADRSPGAVAENEKLTVIFEFPLNVMKGSYFLSFGFTHFFGETLEVMHRRYDAIKFDVHPVDRTFGIANLHATISTQRG